MTVMVAHFAIMGINFKPSAGFWSARTASQLDALVAGTDVQPLQPPPSIRDLDKVITNTIPNNLGVGEDESVAVLADWRQVYVGLRQQVTFTFPDVAGDPEDSTDKSAFMQHQRWIKATMRLDVQLPRPKALGTLTGIDPVGT